ncbi:hypothetical protein OCF59_06130, partial [Bacillus mobilis]
MNRILNEKNKNLYFLIIISISLSIVIGVGSVSNLLVYALLMTVLLLFLVLFIKRIERTIFFIITMISILVLTNLSQSNYFKIINYSFYIFACLLLFILILDLVVKGKKLEFKFQMLDVLVLM